MTTSPPLVIDGQAIVTIRNLRIAGGYHNIHIHKAQHVIIADCELDGPSGILGKHVLCDQCAVVEIRRVHCTAGWPTGDGINLHDCGRGTVEDCSVSGQKRRDKHDTAVPLVIDGEHSGPVAVRRFKAVGAPAPTITIASGSGHVIEDITGPAGCLVQIGSVGYKSKPGRVNLKGVPFKRVQSGIDGWLPWVWYDDPKAISTSPKPKPAGWSWKRFRAWLANKLRK